MKKLLYTAFITSIVLVNTVACGKFSVQIGSVAEETEPEETEEDT